MRMEVGMARPPGRRGARQCLAVGSMLQDGAPELGAFNRLNHVQSAIRMWLSDRGISDSWSICLILSAKWH